jgi:hypothetical protein
MQSGGLHQVSRGAVTRTSIIRSAHRLRGDRICGRFNPLSGRRSHTLAQPFPSHQDTVGEPALPEGQTAVSHHTDTQIVNDDARPKAVNLDVFPAAPARRVVVISSPRRTASLRWRPHAARHCAGGPSVCPCKRNGNQHSAATANSSPRPSARPAGRAPSGQTGGRGVRASQQPARRTSGAHTSSRSSAGSPTLTTHPLPSYPE